MDILVPAAFAFAIIIPLILLLYFMRPKRQERVIGSTLLWERTLQDLQASQPWQRLRITPLLLLQLLAAAAIVLVLARPAIFVANPLGGDSIIILQSSASMQATDVTPSRFEYAKSRIADIIDTLGPGDHLSLITMARTPRVLIASSQNRDQLMAALQRARVTNQDADLEQALSLAGALTAGHSNDQVLVVGDGHVINPNQQIVVPFQVRYLRIGTDAPHASLQALAARSVQGNLIALAQVVNYGQQQRALPVELYADDRLVGVRTITLAPGASGALQWGPLPATTKFLHARLDSQDAMVTDHDAWAVVGGGLHGRALLVTNGNRFLETALRLQSRLDLYETTPAKYVDTGTYDLTIFDGFVPPILPAGSALIVNPPSGVYPFGTASADIHVSRISTNSDPNQLLSGVDLSSIHVLRGSHQLLPASWMQPVVATPETPLLLAGEHDKTRMAVLGFDLHDTDFPLQPSFPILLYNLVNWFLPSPVPGDAQVAAGNPVTVQAWPGADRVSVTGPDQQTVTVGPPFPVTPYSRTDQPGMYQVVQHVRGQDRLGAFTVNLFDPLQSRLAPAANLPVAHVTNFADTRALAPRELREIWPWIAAALLLLLCAEWWLFSRNYQQSASRGRLAPSSLQQLLAPLGSRRAGPLQRRITELQRRGEKEYRGLKKRVGKAVKRLRGGAPQQTAKGERRA